MAFVCVLISVWVARTFLVHNGRLYSAMALFACTWMLVLGGYSAPGESPLANLATDIAAVLLVYIGGLLVGEARARKEGHSVGATFEQRVALRLLFLVAVVPAISVASRPLSQCREGSVWRGESAIEASRARCERDLGSHRVCFVSKGCV